MICSAKTYDWIGLLFGVATDSVGRWNGSSVGPFRASSRRPKGRVRCIVTNEIGGKEFGEYQYEEHFVLFTTGGRKGKYRGGGAAQGRNWPYHVLSEYSIEGEDIQQPYG